MDLYTRKGDDGTTGLLFGGRVPKDSPRPEAGGDVDEAQAAIGVARAELGDLAAAGNDLAAGVAEVLLRCQRELWVLMAELATLPEHRDRLEPGTTLVTPEMVVGLEADVDRWGAELDLGRGFVVPGEDRASALLDVARTVARRAERRAVAVAADGSSVVAYLNRLSSVLWVAARRIETQHRFTKG